MQILRLVFTLGSLLLVAGNAFSAPITVFFDGTDDDTAFEAATGPGFTVDNFGTTFGGGFSELDASTNLGTGDLNFGGPILPGTVAAGATYSAPTGISNHPNGPMSLSSSTAYNSVFLSALNDPSVSDPPISITVTFDNPVSGFGFDSTSYLMGDGFDIQIMFLVGDDYIEHFEFDNDPIDGEQVLEFFGFLSDETDILSVTLQGTGAVGASSLVSGRTNFDDFTYGVVDGVIPIPGAVWLFGSALGLLGWIRRKAT
jgi:hypothetical protein